MISIGIDIGYPSVRIVILDEQLQIIDSRYVLHKDHHFDGDMNENNKIKVDSFIIFNCWRI